MIRSMVGRDLAMYSPTGAVPIGNVVLEARGLSSTGTFTDVSVTARAGEIVGLAGLVGAGRTEVARAIFGLDRLDKGEVAVDGHLVDTSTPQRAVKAGIAYVPEDRQARAME